MPVVGESVARTDGASEDGLRIPAAVRTASPGVVRALRAPAAAFGAVVQNPNLRRAQLSMGASTLAELAFTTAIGVYAFQQGGAAAVGIVGFLRTLPAAVVMPFAGALADRVRRERLLLILETLRALVLGVAAAAVAVEAPAEAVYGLAIVVTIGSMTYRPAHSALLPALCTTVRELTGANAVRSLLSSVASLVGPLGAGVLLAAAGVDAAFAAIAVATLLSAASIALIRYEAPPLPPRVPRPIFAETLEGARMLARAPDQALIAALVAVQAAVRGALTVLAVVLAIDLLDLGAGGVGLLWAAVGAGSVLGSLGSALLVGNARMAAFLAIGVSLWGLPLSLIGLAPSQAAALALLAVAGVGGALVEVSFLSLLQRITHDQVLARVFSVSTSLRAVALALGSLLAPLAISAFGIPGAMVAIGAIPPLFGILAWRRLRRIDAGIVVRDAELELLRGVMMLQALPVPTLEHLASVVQRDRIPAGEFVFREGEQADRLYIIAQGQAEVLGEERRIRTLGPGDCFGEIGLLRAVPRTASVRAIADLDLRAVDGEPFVASVSGYSASTTTADTVVGNLLSDYQPRWLTL